MAVMEDSSTAYSLCVMRCGCAFEWRARLRYHSAKVPFKKVVARVADRNRVVQCL